MPVGVDKSKQGGYLMRKRMRSMAIALIALYVLRTNGVIIPAGCMVAAWALTGYALAMSILKTFCE